MCSVKRVGKRGFALITGFSFSALFPADNGSDEWHLHFPVNSFLSIPCFKAGSWCSTGFHLLGRWRWITEYPTRITEVPFQRRMVIFCCSLWRVINLVWGFVWIFKWFSFHRVHSLTLILQHLLTSEPWMSWFAHEFVLSKGHRPLGKQAMIYWAWKACSEQTLFCLPESVWCAAPAQPGNSSLSLAALIMHLLSKACLKWIPVWKLVLSGPVRKEEKWKCLHSRHC